MVSEEWCDRTRPKVYRYIYGLIQDRERAEDLTQETYARVLRASPSGAKSEAYLRAVALNLVRDEWRRDKVRGIPVPLEPFENLLESSGEDPYVTLLAGHVRELMGRLPEEQRRVLELRIILGLSRSETAAKMGKTEAAVRGLQYRALQSMRQLLSPTPKEV
ncbi:MAG: RNA polymerase sigma factor [Bacillota bacterium]|jgi:RNA polymerase sigma-70 factor (ECF subfamily)